MCGSRTYLTDIVRGTWGRPDAVHMSECPAVANMVANGKVKTREQAAATAEKAGLDVCGGWDDGLWGDGTVVRAEAALQAKWCCFQTAQALCRSPAECALLAVGPAGVARNLLSDDAAAEECFGGSLSCVGTIAEEIADARWPCGLHNSSSGVCTNLPWAAG